MREVLKNTNFLLYAAKHYNNPDCLDIKEFHDDVNRIKYVKRLLNKYLENKDDLKERLIINHLVILFNMFGVTPATKMIFLKLGEYGPQLKPFLIYMNQLPDKILDVGNTGSVIYTSDIDMDPFIVTALRRIKENE